MTGKRRTAERAHEGAAGRGRGRGRRALGLIRDRRARVETFGKRKDTLKVKAYELSVLCGVDVALVVAAADGDGDGPAADVWESTEGAVLARYRALDPEVRAQHTHRAYLEGGLGKEEAKLARVRQAGPTGLDPWDKALDGIATEEEAQGLLEAIDAAIRATEDRMRALGLPVDGEDGVGAGVVLEGVAPLNFTGVDGYPLHAPGGGDNQAIWGNDGFQQCINDSGGAGMEGYHLQITPDMYAAGGSNNNNGRLATDDHLYPPCDAETMQHGYGFHQCAGTGYFGMPAGHQMQELLGWGAAQTNLAMWGTEEPHHAMVPVHYPSAETGLSYMDTPAGLGAQGGSGGLSFAMGASCNFVNATPELSLAMVTTGCGGGDNFINAPPVAFSHTIGGSSDNFTNTTPAQPLAMSYGADLTVPGGYATQWQVAQSAGSGQQSGIEQLHYLSDLEDAQSQAAQKHQDAGNGPQSGIELLHYLRKLEDTQLHLWGN